MNKMKVEGDLRAQREADANRFFGKKFKKSGKPGESRLPYRKPAIEGGSGPRAV